MYRVTAGFPTGMQARIQDFLRGVGMHTSNWDQKMNVFQRHKDFKGSRGMFPWENFEILLEMHRNCQSYNHHVIFVSF